MYHFMHIAHSIPGPHLQIPVLAIEISDSLQLIKYMRKTPINEHIL